MKWRPVLCEVRPCAFPKSRLHVCPPYKTDLTLFVHNTKVNTETQPSFLEEEMFFAPMGDMWMLQAMHGSAHPLLPPGPGLYKLSGDGLFEQIAQRVESVSDRIDIVTDDDLSDVWLDRRTRAGWGETFWDDNDGSDGVISMPDTGDVSMTDQNV